MKHRIELELAVLLALVAMGACARAPQADPPEAATPSQTPAPANAVPDASSMTAPPSASAPDAAASTASTQKPGTAASASTPGTPNGPLPTVVVHKSPTCGCCHLWVDHMRGAGFTVEVRDTDNLEPVKSRVGVPFGKGSCHTAEVGGYFVEGHVPARDVLRLLAEKPDAKGLALPGMPLGSPGMEVPDGRSEPYTVELVGRDGTTTPFARHGE